MKRFEDKLRVLFDAQAFFREPSLDALIQDEAFRPLSDDELEMLSAAGDPFAETETGNDDAT